MAYNSKDEKKNCNVKKLDPYAVLRNADSALKHILLEQTSESEELVDTDPHRRRHPHGAFYAAYIEEEEPK